MFPDSDRRRRGGRMRGGAEKNTARRRIGGVRENGRGRTKGEEKLRGDAARRSVDSMKREGWRMNNSELKLCVSRRKLPGKGRWRSVNATKIKQRRSVAEIVGRTVRRWRGFGQIRRQTPLLRLHHPPFLNKLLWWFGEPC
jgi:hypothetical protein